MTLNEVITTYPWQALALISFLMTLVSTVAQKYLTDQKHLNELKKRQKELQKELKGCKDEKILKELNFEMLQITGVMMKSSFKPLFVTMIPFLLVFAWMRGIYGGETVLIKHWLLSYIGFSIVFSIILRKILKVA